MPPNILRVWARVRELDHAVATYAVVITPKGERIETLGIRASHEGRRMVVTWWRRHGSAHPTWKADLCRRWTRQPGSYQSLPVVKIGQWLTTGEV